ncbi:MAG: sulfur carrier protein ThiS [Kiritimatiellae bacterium]|nr:sulfur carrier protein ThiS [Kiritimatiellia bacterium]
MNIIVNGSERAIGTTTTLQHLLESLGTTTVKKFAVELNGEIMQASAYASTRLKEGDRIEIIQFVGGG